MGQDKNISFKEMVPKEERQREKFKQKFWRGVVHLFVWIGIAVLYYIAFSFFFDTPLEYKMKHSTRKLEQQYDSLSARYEMIEQVLYNVIDRDEQVFNALFESDPYNFDSEFEKKRWENYEELLNKSNKELGTEFFEKLKQLEKQCSEHLYTVATLEQTADSLKQQIANIPAIQPVINKDLTLLTASYGMRMHPFYKILTAHQGVDYTVSEGSRVFATADGRVKDVLTKNTTSGKTVIIDHGNGYETTYCHLGKIYAKRGERVKRGDIIAQSGNSGLSLAHHLHYEIKHNGMRVDPIHYFFMELNYEDYQKIIRIAQTGMQSFD